MIGASHPSVARALAQLRAAGAVETTYKGFKITNMHQLESIAHCDDDY